MPIDIEYENWRQQGDPLTRPSNWTPDSPHANQPSSPVTTSEPAQGEMNDIDSEIARLGLDIPSTEPSAQEQDIYNQQRQRIQRNYEQDTQNIQRMGEERLAQQRTANRLIMGESRAALANLGLLSSEGPDTVSGTPAVQYIRDVEVENQKALDKVHQEIGQLMQAARNARDTGDFELAKTMAEDAKARRKEANDLRLQALQEIRAMKDAERAGDRLAIEKLQEDRAAKRFKMENAKVALDALIAVGFEGFDKISDTEKDKLDREMGFIPGTLNSYYTQSQKLKALEGWNSSLSTNKNTGEVTALYYRLNPDTGELEYNTTSLGKFGERYQGNKSNSPTSKIKLTSAQYNKLLENFSTEDANWIKDYFNQGDKTIDDLFNEYDLTAEEQSTIRSVFGNQTKDATIDKQLNDLGFSAEEKRLYKTQYANAPYVTAPPLNWLNSYREQQKKKKPYWQK